MVDLERAKLPKRVKRVLDLCRQGQTLCRCNVSTRSGEASITYFLEPSGKTLSAMTAQAAIDAGYLAPSSDGLLEDHAQTFKFIG